MFNAMIAQPCMSANLADKYKPESKNIKRLQNRTHRLSPDSLNISYPVTTHVMKSQVPTFYIPSKKVKKMNALENIEIITAKSRSHIN